MVVRVIVMAMGLARASNNREKENGCNTRAILLLFYQDYFQAGLGEIHSIPTSEFSVLDQKQGGRAQS